MKTAMQELMKWWDETPIDEIRLKFPAKATELLEKEKNQLVNAFLSGDDATFHFGRKEDFKSFNEYFDETYKP